MSSRVLVWRGKSHCFSPHFHRQFFIGVLARGECHFACGGRPHIARAGDLVLIPPFQVHTAGCSADTEYYAIYLDSMAASSLPYTLGGELRSDADVVVSNSPLTAPLLKALRRSDTFAIMAGAQAVLDRHAPLLVAGPGESAVWGEPILSKLHEAAGTGISIGSLAADLGLTAATLSKTFRRGYGMQAVFVRNQLRLESAEDLLLSGEAATTAAVECGYSDQAHLMRELQKTRGITPARYSAVYRALAADAHSSAKKFKTAF